MRPVLIRYFDASALAKRYVRAEETTDVHRWLRTAQAATSRLTEVELSSAFARRVREGTMTHGARLAALGRIRTDFQRFHVVELVPAVIERTHTLLERYWLRAADSLQLASALVLSSRIGEVEFVVYDDRLAEAARGEHLTVLP